MEQSRRSGLICVLLVLFLVSLACGLPSTPFSSSSGSGQAETRTALAAQQTALALQPVLPAAVTATRPAPLPPSVQPATSTSQPASATPTPTTELAPTASLTPTLEPTITETTAPTFSPTPTAIDIEALIRAANVLVYEDMAGNFDRKPLVRQAVSEMGFSGGRVIQVNDALGKFKEQLLNSADWDLIVVAAEYRSSVQGEFWQYVYDQVNRGVAVVIEAWYLDQHYTDIQPLMSKCGLEFQKDWVRGASYNISNYAIYWLQPDHPYFQPPQEPASLGNVNYLYWVPPLTDDAGDLLEISSGGDAVLLAGTQPTLKDRYGLLGTCLNGTMVIQTFSTHDYKEAEVVKIWKNSMRYTLANHFLQSE